MHETCQPVNERAYGSVSERGLVDKVLILVIGELVVDEMIQHRAKEGNRETRRKGKESKNKYNEEQENSSQAKKRYHRIIEGQKKYMMKDQKYIMNRQKI